MPFLPPNQQRQSTENENKMEMTINVIKMGRALLQ